MSGGVMAASNSRWGGGYALWLTAGLPLPAALLLAAHREADRQERLRRWA